MHVHHACSPSSVGPINPLEISFALREELDFYALHFSPTISQQLHLPCPDKQAHDYADIAEKSYQSHGYCMNNSCRFPSYTLGRERCPLRAKNASALLLTYSMGAASIGAYLYKRRPWNTQCLLSSDLVLSCSSNTK